MDCHYFDAGTCRSCTHMGQPYGQQVSAKQARAEELLSFCEGLVWQRPVTGPESGFRNKAKMVVAGSVEDPTLGILDRDGRGLDLEECGLYPQEILDALPVLRGFVRDCKLTPYDVPTRRGELKHLIVTCSPEGELMLRFVLRSKKLVVPIRKGLPELRRRLPRLRVISANILREHKAVLEGAEEILLTEQETLPMRLNGMTLHLRPHGFFQTNSAIAAAMYRQGAAWIAASGAEEVLDLYCGVGGFGLHAARALAERDGAGFGPGPEPSADSGRPEADAEETRSPRVRGVEISAEAVRAARTTAEELGLGDVDFETGDAGALLPQAAPEAVVVNPPRRGLGEDLSAWLEGSSAQTVVYSSCNAETLARDLRRMPSLRPVEAVLLDMFPQTDHFETMVLLRRRAGGAGTQGLRAHRTGSERAARPS